MFHHKKEVDPAEIIVDLRSEYFASIKEHSKYKDKHINFFVNETKAQQHKQKQLYCFTQCFKFQKFMWNYIIHLHIESIHKCSMTCNF